MTDIQTFNSPEFGSIRSVEQNGEPWFVGKDVAEALGYGNPQKAIRDHVDALDKGVTEMMTPGGKQQMPKADYFDQQVAANQLTGLNETADALRIPRRTFVAWLVERKYLYRNHCNKLVPDPCMNDGLFQPKEWASNGAPLNGTQTMVTPKGRETFRLMLFGAKKD